MDQQLNQKNRGNLIPVKEMADLYGFLASILNNRPGEEKVKNLRDYFLHNQGEPGDEMEAFWQECSGMSDALVSQELSVEWTRLFRGLNPRLGPPPPYTGMYCAGDGVGIESLRCVQNVYRSEGLGIDRERGRDRADYLGFELEFMAYLANRVSAAQENREWDKADKYLLKLDDFTRKFVAPWLDTFVDKALPQAQTTFFKGYLKLLQESVRWFN